jgi:2,3-bisphosphoglycerate-dependent phosphoglycerate mutase
MVTSQPVLRRGLNGVSPNLVGMSDLQCPARVFVARHGEAEYEERAILTDDGGSLSAFGREQARQLGQSLAGERIARVYCSALSRAVQTAEIAAGVLGVAVTVREGLGEFGVGVHAGTPAESGSLRATYDRWLEGDLDARVKGAESGRDVVERFGRELGLVADAHRGEAVLVVTHGGTMSVGVPALARNLTASYPVGRVVANCGVVALEADGDGWVARSWCGEVLEGTAG